MAVSELERRRAWALRNGNRLWLWPEVAPPAWRAALTEIERTCHAVLAGRDAAPLSGDPVALELAGYASGMGPQLGWWIERSVVPAPASEIARGFVHQLRANRARKRRRRPRVRLSCTRARTPPRA